MIAEAPSRSCALGATRFTTWPLHPRGARRDVVVEERLDRREGGGPDQDDGEQGQTRASSRSITDRLVLEASQATSSSFPLLTS